MPSGGARIGAGRKKGDKHLVRLWITSDEEKKIKAYLETLRAEDEEPPKHLESIAVVSNEKESAYDWKFDLRRKINKALKTSKDNATELLTAEIAVTLNKPILERTESNLAFLATLVDLLRDKRKKAESFESNQELLEIFLMRNGYFQEADENLKQHWIKGTLKSKQI